MSRLLPLTARVSQEDIEFLATIDVDGARSTGDKVRHIIAEARLRREVQKDFDSAYRMIRDLIDPSAKSVRNAENRCGAHSELTARIIQWLPDIMAYLVSSEIEVESSDDGGSKTSLAALEKGLAKKVFLLLESVLRMGITDKSACYDESIISNSIGSISELCKIVLDKQQYPGGVKK